MYNSRVELFSSDYFRRSIGIPFMDSLLQQLSTRFSVDNRRVAAIMSLVPSVISDLSDHDLDSLEDKLHFWDNDLPAPDALKVSFTSKF